MGKSGKYTAEIQAVLKVEGLDAAKELRAQLEATAAEADRLQEAYNSAAAQIETLQSQLGDVKHNIGMDVLEEQVARFKKTASRSAEEFSAYLKSVNLDNKNGRFDNYFAEIDKGAMTASEAITMVKSNFEHLLQESHKNGSGLFDSQQVMSFTSSLESMSKILDTVVEKINSIEQNGVKAIGDVGTSGGGGNIASTIEQIRSALEGMTEDARKAYAPVIELIQALKELGGTDENKLYALSTTLKGIGEIGKGSFGTKTVDNIVYLAKELKALNADGVGAIRFDLSGINGLKVSKASLSNLAEFLPILSNINIEALERLQGINLSNFNELHVTKGAVAGITEFVEAIRTLEKAQDILKQSGAESTAMPGQVSMFDSDYALQNVESVIDKTTDAIRDMNAEMGKTDASKMAEASDEVKESADIIQQAANEITSATKEVAGSTEAFKSFDLLGLKEKPIDKEQWKEIKRNLTWDYEGLRDGSSYGSFSDDIGGVYSLIHKDGSLDIFRDGIVERFSAIGEEVSVELSELSKKSFEALLRNVVYARYTDGYGSQDTYWGDYYSKFQDNQTGFFEADLEYIRLYEETLDRIYGEVSTLRRDEKYPNALAEDVERIKAIESLGDPEIFKTVSTGIGGYDQIIDKIRELHAIRKEMDSREYDSTLSVEENDLNASKLALSGLERQKAVLEELIPLIEKYESAAKIVGENTDFGFLRAGQRINPENIRGMLSDIEGAIPYQEKLVSQRQRDFDDVESIKQKYSEMMSLTKTLDEGASKEKSISEEESYITLLEKEISLRQELNGLLARYDGGSIDVGGDILKRGITFDTEDLARNLEEEQAKLSKLREESFRSMDGKQVSMFDADYVFPNEEAAVEQVNDASDKHPAAIEAAVAAEAQKQAQSETLTAALGAEKAALEELNQAYEKHSEIVNGAAGAEADKQKQAEAAGASIENEARKISEKNSVEEKSGKTKSANDDAAKVKEAIGVLKDYYSAQEKLAKKGYVETLGDKGEFASDGIIGHGTDEDLKWLNDLKTKYNSILQSLNQDQQNELDKLENDLKKRLGRVRADYEEKKNTDPAFQKAQKTYEKSEKDIDDLKQSGKGYERMKQSSKDEINLLKQKANALKEATEAYQKDTSKKQDMIDAEKAYNDQLKKTKKTLKENGDLTTGFGSKLSGLISKFKQYFTFYKVLSDIRKYAKQMIDTAVELNSAFTQMQIVTGATDSQMERFAQTTISLSKSVGQSVTDVAKSIETFSRLGYNLTDASSLAKYATVLSNVASVSTDQATTGLTSIIKGYNMQVDQAEHVSDVLVNVGQKYAVSAAELMEAFEKSGAALNATNTSFEKSTGLIAAANASVQNASTVGTALKTVSARIRGSKSDLSELGEDAEDLADGFSKYASEIKALTGFDIMMPGTDNQFKDIYDIFEGISGTWDKLSDTAQARVSEILGGTRQLQVISSIIGNWKDAAGAYETATNSIGAATQANNLYMETAQAHINQFKASFQELSRSLVENGTINRFVDAGRTILEIITKISDKFGSAGVLAGAGGIAATISSIS